MSALEKITLLIAQLNTSGRGIPTEMWDIPEFPFQFFDEFIADVASDKVRILRHSRNMESSLFSILANRKEKFQQKIGQFFFWAGFPLAIGFGFFLSWWLFGIVIVTYSLGSKMISSSYNSTILRSSVEHEVCFCFLYYAGQISVGLPDTHDIYFYEGE